VDSVAVTVGQRILVKNEADGTHNGPYVVTATGGASAVYILTRATDSDTGAELLDGLYFVTLGTVNAGLGYYLSNSTAPTLGTDNLTYTLYSTGGSSGNGIKAGTGLLKQGNVFSVLYGTTAGSAAQGNDSRLTAAVAYSRLPVGTTANSVAAGDDSRFYNVPPVTVTAAAYTLLVTDRAKAVETTYTGGVTLTIDPSVFSIGDVGEVVQIGAGQITFVPASGVSFVAEGGLTKSTTVGAVVGWRIRSTGSVLLNGSRA